MIDRDTIADHERWVCVHGHFYQPPRENPWLDAIEPQPSARPYPDWNARITAECYRPNASARIVDGEGRIVRIVDNYARMSFNVGPTLMSWFEREAPDVHAALIAADRASRDRFGGHGSAMAQAYNHVIMPLASPRDRRTQVRWGVADFAHRFGRPPEGMWLPECAVDTATLEELAAAGIAFTVLAPRQAARVRAPGGAWIDVRDGSVDPGRVYRCRLPSGRAIDLYFYDGGTSQAVAFERLLGDGNRFVERLLARPRPADPSHPTLCHIATDGETYGHHHRYGDMALAWALTTIDRGLKIGARLTNYAEYRARFPATWEAEIVERSSWSCVHGVERWRADCGCSGGHPGWRQTWRAPLRAALDDLRDRAAEVFTRVGEPLLHDPWAARDAYVDVILDRSPERIAAFVATHARGAATEADVVRILELCELERHAMLMYTSCGWFFDELSGIETVQVLAYAARVCELAERLGGAPVEPAFVEQLARAPSNVERYRDGRGVWDQLVAPSRVDLPKVVAHHAVSAAIAPANGDVPARARVYCYEVTPRDVVVRRAGKARLVAGTVRCTSEITREHAELAFAALHLGEPHVTGAVRAAAEVDRHRVAAALADALADAHGAGDLAAARQTIERLLGPATLSLGSLFGRERDRALGRLLEASLRDAEEAFARIYDEHGPMMRYLAGIGIEVPETFRDAAELVLRHRVLDAIRADPPRYDEIRAAIAEAAEVGVRLDVPEVAYAAGEALHRMLDRFARTGDDVAQLEELARMAEIASRMESPVDLWHAQNACVALRDHRLPGGGRAAAGGDPAAARVIPAFARLCAAVHVYVEAG